MKKTISVILVLSILLSTMVFTFSSAEKYSYSQIVEKIDDIFTKEDILLFPSSETDSQSEFSSAGVLFSRIYDDPDDIQGSTSFHFYDKKSNQGHIWMITDFRKIGKCMEAIAPLLYDWCVDGGKLSLFLFEFNDGDDYVFNKVIEYAPNLTMREDNVEYCENIQQFIDVSNYWSNVFANNPKYKLEEANYDSLNNLQSDSTDTILKNDKKSEVKETDQKEEKKEFGASAKEYSLHSGVLFGMTLDEVKKTESGKGFYVSEQKIPYTFYDKNGNYDYKDTNALMISGSMAGIPDSELYYFFDENNRLFAAVYQFGDHSYSSFNDIQSLINNKYSDRKADEEYTIASQLPIFAASKLTNGEIYDYKTMQIELEDYSRIGIAHALMYSKVSGYDKESCLLFGGKHWLEYRFSSVDEIEAVNGAIAKKEQLEQEEQQREEEERERQRNEDI